MKCNMKIMIKYALGLGAIIIVAYSVFPAAREWIAAASPFLFFLICPLMMLFMMKSMQSCDKEQQTKNSQVDTTASKPLLDHAPIKD
ncbi:DUF2933 domain-containing protein [Allopusillimonas ginsengisoli]|nr:DUF2933 domain-containing protein [Allopusillimonas ginsengisoli]